MLHIFRVLDFSRKAKKINPFFAKNAKKCEKSSYTYYTVYPLGSQDLLHRTDAIIWLMIEIQCTNLQIHKKYLLSIKSSLPTNFAEMGKFFREIKAIKALVSICRNISWNHSKTVLSISKKVNYKSYCVFSLHIHLISRKSWWIWHHGV